MNILFVVDSLSDGGAGHVVARLASYFQKEGITSSVLPIFDNTVLYSINSDVRICKTYEAPLEHSVLERVALIKDTAKSVEADVVISFLSYINLYSIVASIGQKWKTIVSERNDPHLDPQNKKIHFLRKFLYRLADGIVFQTKDASDYFGFIADERKCIIPNPVPDNISYPYLGERTKRIVSVGRLTKQKNYPMAINAIAEVIEKHPDYIYEIYGQGEEKEYIQSLITYAKLQNKVFLRGYVNNVTEVIKDAALYIMSSNYEGMSNALMEALAIGLPVVSTDHPIGGARALIDDGVNGVLVPVQNYKILAEKINYIIENPNISKRISLNALEVKERYSINKIGKRWRDFIVDVLHQ